MKTSFLTIVFVFLCGLLFYSCHQEIPNENATDKTGITACSVNDPAKNLSWLAEFIEKAKNDKTGRYFGVIWLEQYNAQDVFVIKMQLSSAASPEVRNCEGIHVNIQEMDFFNNLKKDIVIYVHPDYPLNL